MVGRRASPSSSGGNGRGAVSLLMEESRETGGNDGGDQSDTSHEETPEVSDETSSCFEEAMKRCDALRRSPTYLDFLARSPPRRGPPDLQLQNRGSPTWSRHRRVGANVALQLAE